MEIDLELPSHEQDKLDTGSNKNVGIMGSADGFHVAEEENSHTSEHAINACGPNANDSITVSGGQVDENTVRANVLCEPQIGLKFETKEAAYSFYREYARSVGFGITIKASRRSKKSGKFIDVKIACSRFGSKRESNAAINPRSCIKTDCKAGMHMKRTHDEKWILYSFVKEHNHEICPDDFYNGNQGRNKQSGVVACQKKGLQLALDEDDVEVIFEHFMYMQAENPNFFYAIDLDHEKRMRNVFWIDAKGRHDYSIFCDVVFFDTFYIGSKYRIPYVPIIGVNNHLQFMLLGSALIGEQSTSTFLWLMRTWHNAMGGQAPEVIITDQDRFMNEAVVEVFPETRHCYCLWHVLSKMPEKLSHVINQNDIFMSKFNECIYLSWTDKQFEKRWWKLVDKFELKEDEWAQTLYEDRKRWVPTYMRDTFLAGISTTERYGSISSFFDKYIHREATLKEFMERYRTFLQDRCELEVNSDFETQNKQPALRSLSAFERQMSTIYTDAVFKKFQVEVLGIVSCQLHKESEDGETINFRVDDFEERQNFLVAWNEAASNICCLCHSFEYRGFLCKHAILVLQMSGVSNIPSRYILKRWTKEAKVTQNVTEVPNSLHYRVQRFNDLCKRAIKLGEEGSLSQEAYHIARQALEEALENCVGVNNSVRSVLEPNTLTIHGFLGIEEENRSNNLAKSYKKRKTYKKKKVCSKPEGIKIGLKDSCQLMDQMNSRAHPTDNCYVPQQDLREMEIGSRTSILDGYYGSQQSMQGVGQLNSISPIRDSYYGNQQDLPSLGQLHSLPSRVTHYGAQMSMHGLGQLAFRAPTIQGCFDIHDGLEDMEQPISSTQFHGTGSKHVHDKHLSR